MLFLKIALIILIILVFLYLIMILPRFRKLDHSALDHHYYAHRGLHDLTVNAPENSMAAFRLAIERGYGMEMDVQLSKDGIPVVFHDATLKRVCGVDRRVDELTVAELKKLSLCNTAEQIPTFKEFLDLVNGSVPLIVEIKMDKRNDRVPEAVNELLKDYNGAYCIESFHPSVLIWYKNHRPDVFRGQLSTDFPRENKKVSLSLFLLSKMLTNIFARPDFIAYNWLYRDELSFRICTGIYGALPVAWTIRSQTELDMCRDRYKLFIFEGFIPRVDS